jgi:hypothetical protein
MRIALIGLVVLAFIAGCGSSQKYPTVETEPTKKILKWDQ